MLPAISGRAIRVAVRKSLGPHHAATSLTRRVILLDSELLQTPGEFERILIHEIFHFAWRRMSNDARRNWEMLLAREFSCGARGELGWSAEWRKAKLGELDSRERTAAWRQYACESFCDTAAWCYAELGAHEEFTLAARWRDGRRRWFRRAFSRAPFIPI